MVKQVRIYNNSLEANKNYFVKIENVIDRRKWKGRKYFFAETLAFCMNLQNFWRFPREAYIRGQCAFVYLYIFFMMFIASVIMFFEVALGQHASKDSSKPFSLCPIFEGLGLSMAVFCIIISSYSNVLNTHSFLYFFASFNHIIEYTTCNSIPSIQCEDRSSNLSLTPEYVYFKYRIIHNLKNFSNANNSNVPNWRNATVNFFLWTLVGIVVLKGIRTVTWPSMTFCFLPFLVFSFTLISALTVKGSFNGLRTMFVCKMEDFKDADVWRYSLEQALASLGLGIGPIITLGSYVNFQTRVHKDIFYVAFATTISALMIAAIGFCTAGILGIERNERVNNVLQYNGVYSTDFCLHILLSQLITRLPNTVAHVVSMALFFTLFIAGWYSLILLTESAVVCCCTYFPLCQRYKILTNLGICAICCSFGLWLSSPVGYKILLCLDHVFISSAVLLVIICELCAVVYIYGIREFLGDRSSILGIITNFYIQFVWVFFPLFITGVYCRLIYFIYTSTLTQYEQIVTQLSVITSIVPVIVVAVKNCIEFYKQDGIARVFQSRAGDNAESHFENKNIPLIRKVRIIDNDTHSTAGPSTKQSTKKINANLKQM